MNPSGTTNEQIKKEGEPSVSKMKSDFNLKLFVMTESLKQHYQAVKKILEESPEKLQNLFLFIKMKQKQEWHRVLLLDYI